MTQKKCSLRGDNTKFVTKKTDAQKRYLKRQSKDPYTGKAEQMGYRSRAAFKLIELNEKFEIIKPRQIVVDLGAAPGGWCQVASELMKNNGKIIASDLLWIDPLPQVTFIKGDFSTDKTWQKVKDAVGEKGAHVVLSDMAPNTIGHAGTDHLRIMALAELAAECAFDLLKEGGHFACKLFQGGEEKAFFEMLRKRFDKVSWAKPPSSRGESSEVFVVAMRFKG